MQTITTIGLDIAKSVFQVHGVDAAGEVVIRRQLKRRSVLAFFQKLPPCLVGIEACASSHHWSRELQALGHTVRLMPPAYVKPYVKRQLKAALAAAKKLKCNVAVAKLDRLSRDVHFISGLMAHRVPFAPEPPRLGICFSQDACCYWDLAQPKSLAPQPHPGWCGFGRGSVLRDADATRKGRCNRHDAAIELQPERRKGTRSRPKYHLGSVSGIEDRGVA